MRKILILLCTLFMCLAFVAPASAAPTVILDNQQLSFDVPPTIENGRTLVPLRAIFEALGADVEWDGQTRTVTAEKNNARIKLQIGSTIAYKNGSPVQLDVPAKIINDRTLVPLRFVSEALGAKVDWDGPTQTITITSSAGEEIEVHFIDVGQADAIYIELPDHNDILIDGGNRADGLLVVNYLQNQEVDDIEILLATHPHEDHIGGLPDVLDAFVVEKIIDSGYLTNSNISSIFAAKAKAEGNYVSDNYQSFSFNNNIVLEILTGDQTWDDTNNYSVVCRLDTGDIEFLFMGDAETPVENILSGELESEILKVGHHGSYSSTSEAFLNKVKPEVAVICCGAGNRYGHPHQETLAKLKNIGANIYRTDLNGDIIVTTDGKTYSVTTEKTLPSTDTPISQPSGTAPTLILDPSNTSDWVAITDIDLKGEVVTIKNNSNWPVDMTGWYLVSVTGNQTYSFPSGFVLGARETVYITSGRNAKDDGVKYLKWTGSYIWNNNGDPGKLYNDNGILVSEWLGT